MRVTDRSMAPSASRSALAHGRSFGTHVNRRRLTHPRVNKPLQVSAFGKTNGIAKNGATQGAPAQPRPPPESCNTKWPTFTPDPKYIRPTGRTHKTILTIDGGGLRGMFAARLLESLEVIIKDALVERGVKDIHGKPPPAKFNIDLADYFDVMSGTSTGSIIASYLASKGEMSKEFLKTDDDVLALSTGTGPFKTKFKDQQAYYERFTAEHLRPGSCRTIQAIFAAKADQIFPKDWKNKVGLGKFDGIMKCKYPADGINYVLKSVLGAENPKNVKTADKNDRRLSAPSTLYTSLVVPAFQLNQTRTMTFFYNHAEKREEFRYGYATLARNTSKTEKANADKMMERMFGEYKEAVDEKGQGGRGGSEIIFVPGVDFPLWQVVRSSTAAPTFFPVLTMTPILSENHWITKGKDGQPIVDQMNDFDIKNPTPWRLVDGGLTANNPGSAAITFATSVFRDVKSLEDLAVLSIGCGTAMAPTTIEDDEEGALGWVGELINVLMNGNQELSAALMDHFVSKKYTNSAEAVSSTLSDRYVRIQKTAFKKKSSSSDLDSDDVDFKDPEIKIGNTKMKVADLLNEMDRAESKLHYIALAEKMLREKACTPPPAGVPEFEVLEKYYYYVRDYLVPDLEQVKLAAAKRAAEEEAGKSVKAVAGVQPVPSLKN